MKIEHLFIPVGAALQLTAVDIAPDGVVVDLQTTAMIADCPTCQMPTQRIHSSYQRRVADLPLAQVPVQLHLHVRRFRCDNLGCRRTTFSEPVPELIRPYARRTTRLWAEQRQIGLEIGGEPGTRITHRQGMAVSTDTLLRLARQNPTGGSATPRCLGIDDFALRKGQVYGTIFVDLEAHQPIDLMPERSAEVVAQWLAAHPGVEIITRDRSGEYAEGASRGAPDAIQVADRFHLLQNVREMLQRLLERHQDALQAATTELPPSTDTPDAPAPDIAPVMTTPSPAPCPVSEAPPALPPAGVSHAPALTKAAQASQNRRARRHARYTAVQELLAQAMSMRAIAKQLQLSRKTVRQFAVAEQFPERGTRRAGHSKLDPFIPYLQQQLAAGQDNAMQLWRNLRDEHRYTGSRALVSRWVAQHRQLVPAPDSATPRTRRRGRPPVPAPTPSSAPPRRLSARQAAWLLVRRPKELEADEQRILERLCHTAPMVDTAYHLAQDFIQMVRTRQATAFDDWLTRATASGI
ncbi:MAG: ISL3 family transposase, partial [Chloroflexales bacterium]